MTRETGGFAFPLMPPCDASGQSAQGYPYPETGMTLRDWFAGQALAGDLAATPNCRPSIIGSAERAYAYADAMLAERRKS
ncbi:hypothetical protein [Mesorhizobium ventifaucium]|uniref:Uncharacterized protein n=1 Tax=Mesorhizobium ventifaucium TaxID=666020 RepID=A0ABN8JN76_9HYPH|nr:hypothetical protein [Mesorhizobium ventifaucium]CAH2399118.1 conserved hypothetical protein [Mesorhizobium ventifaucium]